LFVDVSSQFPQSQLRREYFRRIEFKPGLLGRVIDKLKVCRTNCSLATEDNMNTLARATVSKSATIFALFLLLGVVVSCRMVESLSGGEKGGTVSTLWPDVPPFAGATKADLQIPLGPRLILRAATKGKVNFIAFTTSKSAQEVKDFYSADRMKAVGWSRHDQGCIGDTEDKKNQGAVCLFQRKDGDKDEVLAIIVAENEKTKQTDIFYARIETSQPTPSPTK
jgi:hypothetical protein